jgi:hypothetical protein
MSNKRLVLEEIDDGPIVEPEVNQNHLPKNEPNQMLRISTRERVASTRLNDYDVFPDQVITEDGDLVNEAMIAELEPVTLDEALSDSNWLKAMREEFKSIEKNNTWVLMDKAVSKRPIDVKWVFKLKMKPNGEIVKYKARLVAMAFFRSLDLTLMKCLHLRQE